MPDEQTNPNQNPSQQTPPQEPVREIHHHHYHDRGRFFPRFFWGLFIIFLGLMFLAQSAGWISGVDMGLFLSKIWPVLIIIVGLSILSRGGIISGLISAVILIAILGIIASLLFSWPIGNQQFGFRPNQRQVQSKDISIDKQEGIQSASVSIKAGAGQINITGGSGKLVTGSLFSNITDLEVSNRTENNIQKVDIRTINGNMMFGGRFTNTLTVNLGTSTPVAVDLDAGASSQNLDFSEVQLNNLTMRGGASSVNLTLGDKVDNGSVDIDGGASSVRITLPRSVGAKVTVDGGLASRNFQDFNQLDNRTYQSANYDQASKKINISLRGGASSYTIGWR